MLVACDEIDDRRNFNRDEGSDREARRCVTHSNSLAASLFASRRILKSRYAGGGGFCGVARERLVQQLADFVGRVLHGIGRFVE